MNSQDDAFEPEEDEWVLEFAGPHIQLVKRRKLNLDMAQGAGDVGEEVFE